MLSRLKSRIGTLLNRNPRVSFLTYDLLVRCPLLLPHDSSYLGVRQIFEGLRRRMPQDKHEWLLLDVGANNGISSAGFLHLLPAFKVLAIEPNATHSSSLGRIAKRYPNRFEYKLAAAGDADSPGTEITLFTPFWKNLALHTLTAATSDVALDNVTKSWGIPLSEVRIVETRAPLITVDSLHVNPAIVKIDAEGSETKIVEGMRSTLDRCRPVLIIEVTSLGVEGAVGLASSYGYRSFRYDETSRKLVPDDYRTASHANNERNRYLVPPDLCHELGL